MATELHPWRRVKRLADRPWASAFGLLLFGQVVVTLLGFGLTADALENLVPSWFITVLAVAYGVGGAVMLVGLMFEKSNFEAAACILIASGLIVRGGAILAVLGVHPETVASCTFFAVFTWACAERYRQILHGDRILRVHQEVKLEFEGESE